MTNKVDELFRIANNALYFDDNSDYETALWKILKTIKPEMFDSTDIPKLEYIEHSPPTEPTSEGGHGQ